MMIKEGEKEKKQIWWMAVKTTCFLVVFLLLGLTITNRIFADSDKRSYQLWESLYREPEDSVDAIFVGACNMYTFFNPIISWKHYGLATLDVGAASLQATAIPYIIEEARKTQPDALYIINLKCFKNSATSTVANSHRLTDFMHFSDTKIRLVNDFVDEISSSEEVSTLEYYLPFIRYHSGWDELEEQSDFVYSYEEVKGAVHYQAYTNRIVDISDDYVLSEKRAEIDEDKLTALNDLLTYIKKNDVNVLFVISPQGGDEKVCEQMNSLQDYVEDNGFSVLNMTPLYKEIGIDLEQDYYSYPHTNIHGAIKCSDYMSQYLIDHYGFSDKRGNKDYDSWNQAEENYRDYVSDAVFDVEYEGLPRDYNLNRIKELKLESGSNEIACSWERISGAEKYYVYRKTNDSGANNKTWELVASVKKTSYTDQNVKDESSYSYSIIPAYEKDGQTVYGQINYIGSKIKK